MSDTQTKSWYSRIFGRSFFWMIFGNFFDKKNNAAGIIALVLVLSLCYTVVVQGKYEYVQGLLNIVFVVIGYYFGAKQSSSSTDADDSI